MIYSMTGFGRGEASDEACRITAEIKTVNNRYLDFGIRMPRVLNPLEAQVRELVKKYVKRGKIDILISCDFLDHEELGLDYNSRLAGEYVKCLREMAQEYDLRTEISAATIARMPDVFKTKPLFEDDEHFKEPLSKAVLSACEGLNEARGREGAYLFEDIKEKLGQIRGHLAFIKSKSPEIIKAYEERLRERIQALLGDVQKDESKILSEVAIFADKSAIDEELVRLSSHLEAFLVTAEKESESGEGVGRKLDFIVQEMNREANTILSKSSDIEVSAHAVEIKTEIEKIREQIQNIE